jgi:hypothetical protein
VLAAREAYTPSIESRVSSRLRGPTLRSKTDPMARRRVPCNLIAASAMRSSTCIYWNVLLICIPYLIGKVLDLTFQTADTQRQNLPEE